MFKTQKVINNYMTSSATYIYIHISDQDTNAELISVCFWSLNQAVYILDYSSFILRDADAQVV